MDASEGIPSIPRKYVACANCGADQPNIKYKISPEDNRHRSLWLNGRAVQMDDTEFIVECDQCGLVFVNPRIPDLAGLTAYNEEAELAYFSTTRAARYAAYLRLVQRLPTWAETQPRSFLDIGCGDGVLLEAASQTGIAQIAGTEISRPLIALANQQLGAEIVSDREVQSFAEATFDVVAIINVLEHIHEPNVMLAKVWEVLKPGGLILIHVPNFAGLPAKIEHAQWSQIEPYAHFYYFTPKTLASILVRHGFSPLARFHLNISTGLRAALQDGLARVGFYLDNGLGMVAQKKSGPYG